MAKKKKEVLFPEVVYMEDPGKFGSWTETEQEDLCGKNGARVGVYCLERVMQIKRVKRMVEKDVAELE